MFFVQIDGLWRAVQKAIQACLVNKTYPMLEELLCNSATLIFWMY